MRKRRLTAALILVMLLVFTASAFSSGGPRPNKYGPIVILGHPWGEYERTTYTPACYRPSPTGGSSSGIFPAPGLTNFVVQFYMNYVVKQQTEGQILIHKHGRSE
jgi:hypothetical protein